MCCGIYGPDGTGDENHPPSLGQDSPGDPVTRPTRTGLDSVTR